MAWKVITFFALIALSESKPPTSEQRVKIENMLSHIGSQEPESEEAYASSYPFYEFTYEVSDPHTHDFKGHHEQRKGYEVKGYYWLIQPDGLKRTVKYHADKHSGFKAHVEYIKLLEENENARDETNEESNTDGENDNAGNVNSEDENNIENENGGEGENMIRGEEGENSTGGEEGEEVKETNKGEQEETEQEDNSESEGEGSNIPESEPTIQGISRGRNDEGRRNALSNNENHGREQQDMVKSWNRVRNNLRRQEHDNDRRNNGDSSRGQNNIRGEKMNRGVGIWQPNKVHMWGKRYRNEETGSNQRSANNQIKLGRAEETNFSPEEQNLASNGANGKIDVKVRKGANQETESKSQAVEQGNSEESQSRQGHRGESRRNGEGRRGQRHSGKNRDIGNRLNNQVSGNRNEESQQPNDNQRNEINQNQEGNAEKEQITGNNENNADANGGGAKNSKENEINKIIKSEYHVIIHHPKKHRA